MTVAEKGVRLRELVSQYKILVMPGKVWFGENVPQTVRDEYLALRTSYLEELQKADPPDVYFPQHDPTRLEVLPRAP